MQGKPITDIVVDCGECVNTPTSYHLYRVLRHLARACWYASHTIAVVMGTLTPCLENSSIIPFGCLMFYPFCHLVYPFATVPFPGLSSLLRVHPSLWLVCEGILHFTGAPLNASASKCYRTFWRTYKRFYRLTSIQPTQVLQFRLCACL